MYELIDVIEFLLQSSFRNPIKLYYNWIVILCMMCSDWTLHHELFIYFDMFYIQWHRLAKEDLWNKVYMNMNKETCSDIMERITENVIICAELSIF
jgi:hypothetical protein